MLVWVGLTILRYLVREVYFLLNYEYMKNWSKLVKPDANLFISVITSLREKPLWRPKMKAPGHANSTLMCKWNDHVYLKWPIHAWNDEETSSIHDESEIRAKMRVLGELAF